MPGPEPADTRRILAASLVLSLLLHGVVLASLPLPRPSLAPRPLEVRLVSPPAATAATVSPRPVSPAPRGAAPARPRALAASPSRTAVFASPAITAAVEAAPPSALRPTPPATDAAAAEAPAAATVSAPLVPPDLHAAYAANPRPPYPLAARRLGQEGRVLLRVEVRADGACGEAVVAMSSGWPLLDEAALAAVRRWRFVPARRGGEPVAATVEIPVVFRLTDYSSADPGG